MLSVSVIIPVYNRASLIGATLANLLAQTLPPREIIVVDDGSTDATREIVREFGPAIRLIEQANLGPGAARNAGLTVATGDFIQFQDSDDLYSLNKLEAQALAAEKAGADIVFSPWAKAWIQGRTLRLEDHVLQQAMPPAGVPLTHWWFRSWSTVFQSLLVRSSFVRQAGQYRTDLRLGEDSELFLRCLLRQPQVAFAPEALTIYRLHEENKLTENSGRPSDQRVLDWARCLQLGTRQAEEANLEFDWWTRALLVREAARQIPYVDAIPDAPQDVRQFLHKTAQAFPAQWTRAVDLWVRLEEKIRLGLTGARWREGFQSGKITPAQVRLIEQLGFSLA